MSAESSADYDPPTLDTLQDDLLLEVATALLPTPTAHGIYAQVALSLTCQRLQGVMYDLVIHAEERAKAAVSNKLEIIVSSDTGRWLLDSVSPRTWRSRTTGEAAGVLNNSVKIFGAEGFSPKVSLYWHRRDLSPLDCHVASELLMTAPRFFMVDLQKNPSMGDAGLKALLPALKRQLSGGAPRRWVYSADVLGSQLEVLRLHECGLGDEGVCALAEMIGSLQPLPPLKQITLHGNSYGVKGGAAIDALQGALGAGVAVLPATASINL